MEGTIHLKVKVDRVMGINKNNEEMDYKINGFIGEDTEKNESYLCLSFKNLNFESLLQILETSMPLNEFIPK